MAQNTNPKGEQDQRMGSQGTNQGALNPERRGHGGFTEDEELPAMDRPSNQRAQDTPTQRKPGQDQRGSVGRQNMTDRTKPSAESPRPGSVQQRGNMDSQRDGSIGQRGDGQAGAGQQNESIERSNGRPETERR